MQNMKIAAAALALAVSPTISSAATMSGTFQVEVRNYEANGSRTLASATEANESQAIDDTFTYTGLLDFGVYGAQTATYTIAQFLATGTGTVTGLDANVGNLQLSYPTFKTTSLFTFKTSFANAFNFSVTHDDGVSVFDDGVSALAYAQPTGVRTTGPGFFDGGDFKLIYAASNGNPSVLKVDVAPVPLPAAGWMLLAAIGGIFGMKRRNAAP